MTILNAFSGVSTIFLVGFLGFFLARKKLIGQEVIAVLPRFVTVIALPPYLLRTATTTMDKEHLMDLFAGAGIPFLAVFLAFAVAGILSVLMRVKPRRKGLFLVGFATSNAMNIGLPINIALFGEAALPYALVYFLANATTFWTFGCYSIARSGEGANVVLFSLGTLRRIFSPPLVGFGLGLLLVYLEWQLPVFLDKSFKYVGDMAIPLGTIYVGIMISSIRREDLGFDRDTLAVFAGRFLVSPLIVLFLTWLMPVPPLMRNVFLIQSSLPVMINAAILAGYYKADTRYATLLTGVSTLLSVITIPLFMLLITAFLT